MERVFLAKIEELVARSHGQIRADKARGKLVAIGYQGSPRTTRRWVADAKRRWRGKHGRLTRPWIPEPGLWMQWDYGDGPRIDGVVTVLFCAWLAWSRFRVVVPLRDSQRARELRTCEVSSNRHNVFVRIVRSRENVFTVTATSQELSALVAGARMALEAMRAAPEPPPKEAVEILERVMRDFDQARERLAGGPAAGG